MIFMRSIPFFIVSILFDAALAGPLSPQEAALEIRVGLAQIIERARFLGIDAETMSALLTEELSKES